MAYFNPEDDAANFEQNSNQIAQKGYNTSHLGDSALSQTTADGLPNFLYYVNQASQAHEKQYGIPFNRIWNSDAGMSQAKQGIDQAYQQAIAQYNAANGTNIQADPSFLGVNTQAGLTPWQSGNPYDHRDSGGFLSGMIRDGASFAKDVGKNFVLPAAATYGVASGLGSLANMAGITSGGAGGGAMFDGGADFAGDWSGSNDFVQDYSNAITNSAVTPAGSGGGVTGSQLLQGTGGAATATSLLNGGAGSPASLPYAGDSAQAAYSPPTDMSLNTTSNSNPWSGLPQGIQQLLQGTSPGSIGSTLLNYLMGQSVAGNQQDIANQSASLSNPLLQPQRQPAISALNGMISNPSQWMANDPYAQALSKQYASIIPANIAKSGNTFKELNDAGGAFTTALGNQYQGQMQNLGSIGGFTQAAAPIGQNFGNLATIGNAVNSSALSNPGISTLTSQIGNNIWGMLANN